MLLLLLPLLFNPVGLLVEWLPAAYLAVWPIIIQTMGRETLSTHTLVLIIFILTRDSSRHLMYNLIGFDLISLPLGVAVIIGLLTEKGKLFLQIIQPIFNGAITLAEPLFLLVEIYLVLDMIGRFNRWIAHMSNIRDENSTDISNWDPPLTRAAIIARIVVIILTFISYLGAFLVVQEGKVLLESTGSDIPLNFNHAIAALVTLQLIALTATIYKEEGIVSESAMVSLVATIPIFVASWSFYHLRGKNSGSSAQLHLGTFRHDIISHLGAWAESPRDPFNSGWSSLLGDTFIQAKDQLSTDFSAVGQKLANYYFGFDFWLVLAGRLVCLCWWATEMRGWAASAANYPGRRTLIKVLLVLAYAQMLIQEMDNETHLAEAGTSGESQSATGKGLTDWFNCMWTSAKACSSGSSSDGQRRQHSDWIMGCGAALSSLGPVWLARWRSPIVQRLGQSMLVQLFYLGSLFFSKPESGTESHLIFNLSSI